ncbi:MAG TPA: penicillin-binding protein 2 [Candidatus Sulfobium mesophilum]|nr:penicillin-binding protein 2 [Candidatus Sulfobium mesophilum]
MSSENKSSNRILIMGYLLIAGFAIILIRLWQLQVLQGSAFRKISESNRLRVIGVPAPRGIIFDRNGIPLVKNVPYFCASVIPAEFTVGNLSSLGRLLNVPEEELESKMRKTQQSPFTPVRLREGLSLKEVSYIEARRSDFPGLMIEIEVSRGYLYGETSGHLVGYLGKMTPRQSQDPEFKGVPPNAFVGQWGVERLFDKTLRGTAGQRVIEVDALGREIRLLLEKPPVKGEDISLSIDIALQAAAEKAFQGRPGALVALKPDTGEILGYVSSPSFDPNKFAKGIGADEWEALSQDKNLPMLNRAIQSQYPPGSAFKIIMAIAGLEEGVISDSSKVDCRGGISFGKWHFGCWRKTGHHVISLHRALVESCDVYFYDVGRQLGIDRIYSYATKFGLGSKTGIPLGIEKKGLIPSTKWKMETKKTPWFLGETFVNSIGQGYVSTTPAQMAVMMSSVANGGKVYKPSILKGAKPELLIDAGVKPETIEKVKDALKGVVNEPGGTAGVAKSAVTTIGGKTGTAQVVGIRKESKFLSEKFRDHAWFVAFAPVEEPQVAMSVLVEHGGHGGTAAAPIAKKAIEAYMLPVEKKREQAYVQD